MKKTLLFLALLFAALLFVQCSAEEEEPAVPPQQDFQTLPSKNSSLPTNADSLRILAIGNSFTDDATRYLGKMVFDLHMEEKVGIYKVTKPSCSLQKWQGILARKEKVELKRVAGKIEMEKSGTMEELFAQDWDVIVVQQNSPLSPDFSTFNPYLERMVASAVNCCTNQNVCIAWHMTWNCWTEYVDKKNYANPVGRYERIVKATLEMSQTNKITTIIPAGTAIENARHSTLQTEHDLTRDGVHLSYGTACYVAACTWFQKLLQPVFGIDIRRTNFTWKVTDGELSDTKYESVNVTEDNYKICQQCAVAAVENPFEITPIPWE